MNELEIKQVPFMGSELTAARDADGQIWAGVRWMCDGIGLSKGQMQRQVTNIGSDKVISKGAANLQLPTKGGNQDVLCLKLDFVPLWLAKISITPTMEAETPELAERLEQYQLKAKDVLAAAFLPKSNNATKRGKTGEQITAETKRADAMLLNAKNRTASILQNLYNRAGVKAEYQALALSDFYESDGVKLPRIALAGTKVTYDKGTIAEKLGILSMSGKPHAQAVGAIIRNLYIEDNEMESVPFHRHGHDGTDIQYAESVIKKVDNWLSENEYPSEILGSSGKRYAIKYRSL